MIQKQYGYSDRELLEQIMKNQHYQYFIGLSGFQNDPPFVPSLLVEFGKCLNDEIMTEINKMIIAYLEMATEAISALKQRNRKTVESSSWMPPAHLKTSVTLRTSTS